MSEATYRYNRGARAFHWAIAVLVIANLATGLLNDALEGVLRVIPFHKSTGITILALSLARIAWRLTWRRPPYPPSVTPLEIGLARVVHGVFYVLMLVMPLTGWILASAGKYPLDWFGLFPMPKLAITRADPAYAFGSGAHEVLGWMFAALVVLHVAAALRHHFILKDGLLRRMA